MTPDVWHGMKGVDNLEVEARLDDRDGASFEGLPAEEFRIEG